MNYDYVIIGAGVSGMTSALILAKNGYSVALVEKSKRTAPLIRGFKRGGVYFDTGFHYTGALADGDILDLYFRYLEISDKLVKTPFDPECFDLYRCMEPKFEFSFPVGLETFRSRLHESFPGEKNAVDAYLKALEKACATFPFMDLDAAPSDQNLMQLIQGPTLKQTLDELTDDRLLQSVLSIHCLLHGVPANEIPFIIHACIAGSYHSSVFGIQGGGSALARAFDKQLAGLGVDLYCGQGVDEICFDEQLSVSGVRLADGNYLHCKGCVCSTHPRNLLEMVSAKIFRPAYRKRLSRLEESSSAFILYVACERPVEILQGKNLLVINDLDLNFESCQMPLEKRPMFISGTTAGNGNGKSGHAVIIPTTMQSIRQWNDTLTGKRPEKYTAFKETIKARMKKRLESVCPEFKGASMNIECATPLTIRDYANTPFGSLYGAKHKVGQYNPMPVTRAGGLYLAGQAVAAPGIMGAVISGFVACGNIVGNQRLREAVKQYV